MITFILGYVCLNSCSIAPFVSERRFYGFFVLQEILSERFQLWDLTFHGLTDPALKSPRLALPHHLYEGQ